MAAAALLLVLGACSSPKRLIELGWDEPDTAFLRAHIADMERTPFHGCVFHTTYRTPAGETGNFAWKIWGRRAFGPEDLDTAVADLRATPRRTFTHLFLRVNVTPGDVDWFDDFSPVAGNLRLAAQAAKAGGARGFLFDTEPYEAPLFDYRRQRDAARRTWDEYAAQARRRGVEAMRAIQEGFPDAELMLTFGYPLPWRETVGGRRALADSAHGLLAPFLDGMVEAARGARLIDGYEMSYGFKEPREFWDAYDVVRRGVRPIVADPARYNRVSSVGFGLWMDHDWRRKGWSDVAYSQNYFSPQAFETSLRAAWATTDRYVWIYTEKPRWWTASGGRAELPAAYEAAVRRAIEPSR